MDQASTLVAELHSKLDALDEKVSSFRHQMSCEFDKYKDDLLRDAPATVQQQVDQALRARLEKSSTLRFPDPDKGDTPSSNNNDAASFGSLLLQVPTVQDDLEAGPHSPHEREKEFQGIFTPGYLPLLDSTDRHERRSLNLTDVPHVGVRGEKPIVTHGTSDDVVAQAYSSFDESSLKPKPPTPRRRNTDELSIISDSSDGPVRRSALRRSSSGTVKPMASPKRVRFFDVGKEVLPTTSPMTDVSPLQEIPQTPQTLQTPQIPQIPQVPLTSSLQSENRPVGEHVEYVEEREESPPPKRISSTQALRALSQLPVEDDGTKWTEVRAPPDGSASIERSGEETEESEDEFLGFGSRNGKGKLKEVLTSNGTTKKALKSPPPELVSNGDTDTTLSAEEEEDGDILGEMTPLSPMKSAASKAYSTTHNPQVISQTASSQAEKLFDKSQTTSTIHKVTTSTKPWHDISNENDPNLGRLSLRNVTSGKDGADDGDEEEQFDFDEEPSRPLSKYTIPEEDEEEEEEEEASEINNQDARKYSASPGRTIIKPTADPTSTSSPPNQLANLLKSGTSNGTSATRPTITTSDSGSGSYRPHHPFDTPIVSADIHAQAASLGILNSFVGSVNGTTGLDADDYAQSPGGHNGVTNIGSVMGSGVGSLGANNRGSGEDGQPRSMSERLMMEDFMEMRERERERKVQREGGRR